MDLRLRCCKPMRNVLILHESDGATHLTIRDLLSGRMFIPLPALFLVSMPRMRSGVLHAMHGEDPCLNDTTGRHGRQKGVNAPESSVLNKLQPPSL